MGMNRTPIEWGKNPDGTQGYTWNPVTGCLNHTPEGLCLGGMFPCYARRLANGRLRQGYLANDNIALVENTNFIEAEKDPFYPRFWVERAREEFGAWSGGAKPKGIFVCDMGELFGDWIPEEWTRRILNKIGMSYYREHRFYLLTKQPQNLPKWSPFPDNCWVGVTVTQLTRNPKTDMFDKAMNSLSTVKAKVKYISFEPLLEWDFEAGCHGLGDLLADVIDWLIIGACTGTRPEMEALIQRYPELTLMQWGNKWTAQPKIEWVAEIVVGADKAGIPVFLKDSLKPLLPSREPFYKTEEVLPGIYATKLRQEVPPSEGKGGGDADS